MKAFILYIAACLSLLFSLALPVRAVSINGEGGVHATYGEAYVASMPDGKAHGYYQPGETVTGTWAAFHCTKAGSSACATDLTPSEATKIGGGSYSVKVAEVNKQVYVGKHSYSSNSCGRIQYDIGTTKDGTIGGWVYNFGKDCSETSVTPTPTNTTSSCQPWEPVNTEFRIHNATSKDWKSGESLGELKIGNRIDVNCFAKNGTALLPDAEIRIDTPVGQINKLGAELRDFALEHEGAYRFVCQSQSLTPVCSNTDTLRVVKTVQPSSTPVPTPTKPAIGGPVHEAACNDLRIISGAGALAPATVEVQTEATDNLGSIRQYRYHWGDGEVSDLTSKGEHKYQTGGKYQLWVEVLDSKGNWRTSGACEEMVKIASAPFASHRAYCSEVRVVSGNDKEAPSEVEFRVYGYDNKGEIQDYKLEFGDGSAPSQTVSGTFTRRYETAGTYEVKGFVKDSEGNWVTGDDGSCRASVRVLTKPLTKQPETGAPLAALGLTGLSGVGGVGLWIGKRFLIH